MGGRAEGLVCADPGARSPIGASKILILSQRVGILRRLKNFLPSFKFNQIVNGIYYSKQMYGLTVYGSIWGLPGSMDEENRNSIMLTKEDMRKMQVMQNTVMRLATNCP